MKHDLKILVAASLGLATFTASTAFAADAAPTAPTLGSVLEASGITATGYVAGSYTHLSTIGGSLHQFDTSHNTFSLNQAALTVGYLPTDGFGGSATVMAGNDASVLNTAAGTSGDVAIPQAFVQYKSGGFTLMAGRLLTIAGAEVIASTGNSNFSRGLLFTNLEPLFHTGVRTQFAPTDSVTLTLGVNNGWNLYSDNNTQKTIEAGASFAPLKELSFALNVYFGNEADTTPAKHQGSTSLYDFLVTWSPTTDWTFVLNYDNKSVKSFNALTAVAPQTATSYGYALYANWAINDNWRTSARLERLKDDQYGMTTGISNKDEKVTGVTLTVGYLPTKHAEFDFEVRRDKADDAIFTEFGGAPVTQFGGNTDTQTELAVQALYKF
jgi:hypothetical protein